MVDAQPGCARLGPISLAWLAYRRLRLWIFSVLGRNPLGRGEAALPLRIDADTVRTLAELRARPPRQLRKDADGCLLWDTGLGEFWTPPGSTAYFVRLIEVEARSDVYQLRSTELQDAVFLDCGANVGFITRMALDRGARQVVAIEPSPGTVACLRMNFAREIETGRVRVVEKGLWNKSDILFLKTHVISNPASHSLGEMGEGAGVHVPVTTIDSLVLELKLPRVDFIKMDIEGSEVQALAGAAETIRKFRPHIALGTEHTSDLIANNEAVIAQIRDLVPSYRYICTEMHPEHSPSRGFVLTPHSLFFSA
jgi:FkbM family methyltransferase